MIIIQDTREKEPWKFSGFSECSAQIVQKLGTGDYLIEGKESLIIIDRKKSPSEIASNLGKHIERFEREMERMSAFDYRYVVCEFPYERLVMFPKGAGLPRCVLKRIRVKGRFLVKQMERLVETYEVEFVFCKNREEAQEKAMSLFKEALENGQ